MLGSLGEFRLEFGKTPFDFFQKQTFFTWSSWHKVSQEGFLSQGLGLGDFPNFPREPKKNPFLGGSGWGTFFRERGISRETT